MIFLFIGLMGLYFLSAGPALFLAQRRWVSSDKVEAVFFAPYSPLGLTTSIVPGADRVLHGYLEFWQSLTPELQN